MEPKIRKNRKIPIILAIVMFSGLPLIADASHKLIKYKDGDVERYRARYVGCEDKDRDECECNNKKYPDYNWGQVKGVSTTVASQPVRPAKQVYYEQPVNSSATYVLVPINYYLGNEVYSNSYPNYYVNGNPGWNTYSDRNIYYDRYDVGENRYLSSSSRGDGNYRPVREHGPPAW